MRIALVTYALQIGGIETFLRLLARYFINEGHEVSFIETWTRGKWSKFFSEEGYSVVQILGNSLESRFRHARRIADQLMHYDVVILNDVPFAQASLGLLTQQAIAIPVVHTFLTSMIRNAAANGINWDALSAVSPAVRDKLIQYGISEDKVFCIPNGIDVLDKWPKENIDFARSRTLDVVYLGAISHAQKGVFYLPGVYNKAVQSGLEIHLKIVGDGPDLLRLREMFSSHIEDEKVEFYGGIANNQVRDILKNSDVLIMPSHFEGLPLTLLEAMATGVVPVASRLKGCTDFVVEDGVNGNLVNIGDECAFANALINLASDRVALRAMSKSAWETVKQRFSYVATGSAYLQLVETCRHRREKGEISSRSGELDKVLLGDLPFLPILLVRPVRKMLRILGLYPKPKPTSLLYESGIN